MDLGNLLDFIAISIAIYAFIDKVDRQFVRLKFNRGRIFIIIFLFGVINVLLFFPGIKESAPWFEELNCSTCPLPSTWAYILTLLTVALVMYFIFYSPFPSSRIELVRKYYFRLIENKQYQAVIDQIEKNHLNHIQEYLMVKTAINKNRNRNKKGLRKGGVIQMNDEKLIDSQERKYGRMIYNTVVNNPNLYEFSVNDRPSFYLTIISYLNRKEISNPSMTNSILAELFRSNNNQLMSELNDIDIDYTGRYQFASSDKPLLYLLTNDINVVAINRAYIGPMSEILKEISVDREIPYSVLMESSNKLDYYRSEPLISKIYSSLFYMDVIVSKAIYNKLEDHMWMYYFRSIVRELGKFNPSNSERDEDCDAVRIKIIEDVLNIMFRWREISIQNHNGWLINSIYKCLHEVGFEISESLYISHECKGSLISIILYDFVSNPIRTNDSDAIYFKYLQDQNNKISGPRSNYYQHLFLSADSYNTFSIDGDEIDRLMNFKGFVTEN